MRRPINPLHQRNWDLRAAGNFIGGGCGAGLIATSALAAATGAPFRLAMALGLACVTAGLSLVFLEIGKPWRALNVFFHPHTSWMTRESIIAGPLVAIGSAAVVFGSVAAALGAAALAGGFIYCQARILRASRGIPAWRQAEIVPFIIATGLAEGSGLYLLAGSRSAAWLAFGLLAGALREAAWLSYRAGLCRTPAAERSVAMFDARAGRAVRRAQLGGLVLIAAALACEFLAPGIAQIPACAGGLLAALSGWGVKALLITRAAFTRGVAIPVVPTRGRSGGHARHAL